MEGNTLSADISEYGKGGKILRPGDDESPSGEEESPSGCDGIPSVKEGKRNEATASGNEGMEGKTGFGIVCSTGIVGSCKVLSFENVGNISLASMCFSRFELTREDQSSESNSPSE